MRALAAIPTFIAVLIGPLVGLPAARAAEPPRDLADYVLFAFDDFTTKGLDIDGGAIGVNDGRLTANGAIEGSMTALVADEVKLDQATQCQQLFANTVVQTGPTCGPAMSFATPIIADPVAACDYPAVFPACNPAMPITLNPGDSLTLAPGVYGALDLMNSGSSSSSLTLTGGTYVFCSINGSRHSDIEAASPADVYVTGDIDFGPQSFTRPMLGSDVHSSQFRIFQAGTDAHAPHNSTLDLFLCSPNAHLRIDAGAILTGRFVAETIFTERISVNAPPPPPTTSSTTTLAPTTSTTAAPTTSTTAAPTTSTTGAPTTSTTGAPPPPTFTITTSTSTIPTTSTTAAPTTSTTAAPTTSTTAAPTTSTTAAPTTSTTAAPTTSTTAAPTTSTTEAPATTTSTTEAPATTTSTTEAPATTTSTTEAPASTTSTTETPVSTTTTTTNPCGNGHIEPGEECDPGSPDGSFMCPDGEICSPITCMCEPAPTTTTTQAPPSTTTSTTEAPATTSTTEAPATTTSTTEAPVTTTSTSEAPASTTTSTTETPVSTTTTTTNQCGNGTIEPGEECDPANPDFMCPPDEVCVPTTCMCEPRGRTPTTSSTEVPSSTTTSTTTAPSTTTSTTLVPPPHEICGNCIDDDSDTHVDFEDPDCCGNDQEGSLEITRTVFKSRRETTKMKLRSIIGVDQTLCSLALTHDVFLQFRKTTGELLCAWVPYSKFMKMGKRMVSFWDLQGKVESAKGIRDMAFTCKPDGAVRYYAKGKKVKYRTPGAGTIEITLAFRGQSGNPADNVCHQVTQPFRPGPGGLQAP